MNVEPEAPWDLLETLRATGDVFDLAEVGIVALDRAGRVLLHNETGARALDGIRFALARFSRNSLVRTTAELAERVTFLAEALYDLNPAESETRRIRPRSAPIVLRVECSSTTDLATLVYLTDVHTDARVAALLSLL